MRAVGLCCGFGAGMLGGPLLWLRCDGASREIGQRESEQRTGRRGWGWLGVARDGREQRVRRKQRAESEQKVESEKRVDAQSEMGQVLLACFGKWFTEIFSVNRFPFFPSRFYCKKQTFSV